MTDDRQLLEAAARAAGINASWHPEDDPDFMAAHEGMFLNGARTPDNDKYWNPLRCDGDAFRLAVKLKLLIAHNTFFVDDETPRVYVQWGMGLNEEVSEAAEADPLAATRRAIVRAAVAIAQQAGKETE